MCVSIASISQCLLWNSFGRTPWTWDQPYARPLPTHRTTQIQTSMPLARFEDTIPVFERAKRVHALDRAATVMGAVTLTTWIQGWPVRISAGRPTILTDIFSDILRSLQAIAGIMFEIHSDHFHISTTHHSWIIMLFDTLCSDLL
jgi:hypothetical protein